MNRGARTRRTSVAAGTPFDRKTSPSTRRVSLQEDGYDRSSRGAYRASSTIDVRGRSRGGSRGRGHPRTRTRSVNRPFAMHRSAPDPRLVLIVLGMTLIGFGAISIASCMQQHAARVAMQEQAETERERLERQTVQPDKLGIGVLAPSTPKSQWTQGVMPHLYQTDPAWASHPFAGGTMRANACGPTSLSMVYVYLTGRTDMDPVAMASFADQNNFAPTGATEWAFMTQGAAMLGLRSTSIHATRNAITDALESGMPVICSVAPGDFTTVGHYIVLKSIDERGMVEVFDPNSPYNSAKRWEIRRIINQTKACWAFWM